MKINIAKLQDNGFSVRVEKDEILIHAAKASDQPWQQLQTIVAKSVSDPALCEYAVGAAIIAIERAQILELCE